MIDADTSICSADPKHAGDAHSAADHAARLLDSVASSTRSVPN